MSEETLTQEVEEVIVLYETMIGNYASRTRQMIERNGVICALSKLVIRADLQQGFEVLRDEGKLHRFFEALIVKYQNLFSRDVVEAAQWRLDNPDDLL